MRTPVERPSARAKTAAFRAQTDVLLERARAIPICDSLQRAVEPEPCELPEQMLDLLMDYESGMRGDCAPECIPRFLGDPTDVTEHARWARCGEWMR